MKNTYHFVLASFVFCFLFACKPNKTEKVYMEDKGNIFSTSYTIKYQHTKSLKSEIEKRLQEFDDSLNPFKPSSTISKVNNNESVRLDTLFANVFNRSQEIAKLSDGLFDITISPLINAWGFGFKNMDKIDQQTIDSLKQFVGYQKIKIENNQIAKDDPRVSINTSAIAKGYSSDIIAYLLESYGVENYMIEIGGEIRTKGVNTKGRCWQIAINKPLKENELNPQHAQVILQLCNKSLATSGNYHKYYIKDGKKHAHTIDPRTSHPSQNKTLSTTVIASDCMSADAFATVFMLADTARIRQIAEQEDLDYMLILSGEGDDFEIITSQNFDRYIPKK